MGNGFFWSEIGSGFGDASGTPPPPGERDGFWIPKLIETYSCGAKNVKEICYRILDYREVGVKFLQSPKSDHDMTD